MTTRTAERAQFLTDILTTAVEGGINYWATIVTYKWVDLPPAQYHVDLYETEEAEEIENDDDIKVFHVDIDVIAKGIGILLETRKDRGPEDYWAQFKLANRTNSEDGDYDADVADCILQAGLFGEVVYG